MYYIYTSVVNTATSGTVAAKDLVIELTQSRYTMLYGCTRKRVSRCKHFICQSLSRLGCATPHSLAACAVALPPRHQARNAQIGTANATHQGISPASSSSLHRRHTIIHHKCICAHENQWPRASCGSHIHSLLCFQPAWTRAYL
jgi:hypothetical protein